MAGPSSPTQSACGLTLPGGLSGGYSQPAEPPGRRPFALGLGWPRGVGEGRRAGEGRLALLLPALAFRRGRTDGRVRGLGLRTPDKGLLFSGLHFHRLAKPQRQEEKVRRDLQIPRACKGEHGEPQPYRGWRLAPGPIQPCLGRRSPARGASITLPRSLSHLQAGAGHFPRRLRLTRGSQDPGMSGWRETYGHLVHLRGNSCAGS